MGPPAPLDPHDLGRAGEQLAAEQLAAAGYRLVGRNLRTRAGEIDLLVRRRRLLVAVEVKTRRHLAAPERTVGDRTMRRLQAALLAVAAVQRPRPRRLRVDVVAVHWPRGAGSRPDVHHCIGLEFDHPGGRS